MNKATSIYLDLVRFVAAILVFMHHIADERFTARTLTWIGIFGEDAVMMFFVLSGYVIAYVAAEKENTALEYFVSRLARLYSVAVPALILTVLFDFIGKKADMSLYEGRGNDSYPLIRTLISLSFTNQLWFFDVRYFSNIPYWSISYEFWYYVLFGAAIFTAGIWRWAIMLGLVLMIGPLILLLAPVWILGVYVYRMSSMISLPPYIGWLFFIGSIVAYLGYRYWGGSAHLTSLSDSLLLNILNPNELHKARFFLHDYIVGLLAATHLLGAVSLTVKRRLDLQQFERPICFASSHTFLLYLVHYPLLHLLSAIAPWPAGSGRRTVMLVTGSVLLILVLRIMTEDQKKLWKEWILMLLNLANKRRAAFATNGSRPSQ
jgi:peptidoglycan/LPS O-acetylase OafA/YrhL